MADELNECVFEGVVVVVANEGDDLAVVVGGLPVLASGFVHHAETVVAVMGVGEPRQEVAGGVLGFVEFSGLK